MSDTASPTMDLDAMRTDELIELLNSYEKKRNTEKTTEIYKILNARSDNYYGQESVPNDFWNEVCSDATDEWLLDIVCGIRTLSVGNLYCVASDELFCTALKKYTVDTSDADTVLENCAEDGNAVREAALRKLLDDITIE